MQPLLSIHIVGASLALVAGVVALSSAKGRMLHRSSGLVFVVAMVAMCAAAIVLAAIKGQVMNLIAGIMTAYLVVTALTTVRRFDSRSRVVDLGMMIVAGVLGLTTLVLGAAAVATPSKMLLGLPPYPFFIFGFSGVLGARGDWREIRARGLRGVARLRRHLWRMCLALLIATISFFSIRSRVARVIPDNLVSPAVQVAPIVLVLVALVYWLWRVRRTAARLSPASH
jgi:uncharacterized membrane protein